MFESLEAIDQSIVLAINGWHQPWLDEVMWLISGKLIWIPVYILLIVLYARLNTLRSTLVFVGCAILVVALCDLISSKLIKEFVMRYRPSHHADLTHQLHFYRFDSGDVYKGGMYGFVSSHAANFFGLMTFVSLALRKHYKYIGVVLMTVAITVSFSRIYLGVHYLSDIIGGALLGILISWIVYRQIFIRILGRD